MNRPLSVVCGLMLFSCAHSKSPAPSAAPLTPFSLSVQVEAQGRVDLTRRTIPPGDVLHSQDAFAVKISVDEPVFVYALRYSPKGWSERLFPGQGEAAKRMVPRTSLRLPGATQDYRLDSSPGTEELYVVASRAPLTTELCGKLRIRCDVAAGSAGGKELSRGADELPPPPPPPPPDGVPGDQRDPQVVRSGADYAVVQASDRLGVAILHFAFRHEP